MVGRDQVPREGTLKVFPLVGGGGPGSGNEGGGGCISFIPWTAQSPGWPNSGSLEKLGMGTTAKGGQWQENGIGGEVGMRSEVRLSLGTEPLIRSSHSYYWPGGILVLSFPIGVSRLA